MRIELHQLSKDLQLRYEYFVEISSGYKLCPNHLQGGSKVARFLLRAAGEQTATLAIRRYLAILVATHREKRAPLATTIPHHGGEPPHLVQRAHEFVANGLFRR